MPVGLKYGTGRSSEGQAYSGFPSGLSRMAAPNQNYGVMMTVHAQPSQISDEGATNKSSESRCGAPEPHEEDEHRREKKKNGANLRADHRFELVGVVGIPSKSTAMFTSCILAPSKS